MFNYISMQIALSELSSEEYECDIFEVRYALK